MKRILRLLAVHAYLDLNLMTRDFRLLCLYSLSDAVLNIAAVSGILLLAERFSGIGAWGKYPVLFMLGFAALVRGTTDMFFGYNVAWISRRIGRGQLDHILIQPQPVWMALLTEGFLPVSGSMGAAAGVALTWWAAAHLPVHVTPLWVGLFMLNMGASMAIMISFSYLWGCAAFWAPVAAEEISSNAMGLVNTLKSFPLDGLAPTLIVGLIVFVPAGLVAWAPCRTLAGLEPIGPRSAATPAAAVLLASAAAWLFNRGMRHYARTGSQRYLSFGHRR